MLYIGSPQSHGFPRHAGVGGEEEKGLICLLAALDHAAQPPALPVFVNTSPTLLPAQLGLPQRAPCQGPCRKPQHPAAPLVTPGPCRVPQPQRAAGGRLSGMAQPSKNPVAFPLASCLAAGLGGSEHSQPLATLPAACGSGMPSPRQNGRTEPSAEFSSTNLSAEQAFHTHGPRGVEFRN